MNPDRFHHAHPATAAQIAAELERERAMRRQVYPGRVRDARMTQAEADSQIAVAAAWAEDVARLEHGRDNRAARFLAGDPAPVPPARHGFTWTARRAALAREIALRARIFPRRVAEGALTQADAEHRIACLEALAARYDDGFDWRASNGRIPDLIAAGRDCEARRAWTEWEVHRAAVEQRTHPSHQEELTYDVN